MADRVGQYIDDYRLVRRLGAGGFGEVYLGEQVHDHSQAAVKLLFLKQEDLQGGLEGFIKEAGTTFRLKHPHIVPVLSFGVSSDHTPYLIMDYAPGGTLRGRHPKGSHLPLETVISYLMSLASALQYAHDRRVVHRDVKPENVLIGPASDLWLSDFGIAVTAPLERSFSTQDPGGTLPYMAPEQLRGKPQPASDQYSLGIMVYEWLCGVRPFQGSVLEILGQQLSNPPSPLREKRPDLPPQAEAIVLRALAKDPGDRFRSVQDFATSLAQTNQVAGHLDLAALSTSPLPSPPSFPGVLHPFATQEGRLHEETGAPAFPSLLANPPISALDSASPTGAGPFFTIPGNQGKLVTEQEFEIPLAISTANAPTKPPLPRYGFLYAFICGIVAGPLITSVLQSFSSSPLLGSILGGILCCVAGFITGKTAVVRKMGWITGMSIGLSIFILPLMSALMSGEIGSFLLDPISFLLFSFITTLVLLFTFCGVWLATRTHPYYHR